MSKQQDPRPAGGNRARKGEIGKKGKGPSPSSPQNIRSGRSLEPAVAQPRGDISGEERSAVSLHEVSTTDADPVTEGAPDANGDGAAARSTVETSDRIFGAPVKQEDERTTDDEQTEAESRFQGAIDVAAATGVKGWIWDPSRAGERLRVELVEGDSVLATAVANEERSDLISLGIGDGRYGFNFELSGAQLRGQRHILHLRCSEQDDLIPWSRMVLEREDPRNDAALVASAASGNEAPKGQPTALGPSLRSWVDSISDRGIEGWAMMPSRPSHRCVVGLKQGEQVITRTIASHYRADLLAANIGDGCYAFSLSMPRSLLDGEEHSLEVIDVETGASLTASPIRWRSTAGTAEAGLTRLEPQQEASGSVAKSVSVLARGDHFYRHLQAPDLLKPRTTGRGKERPGTRVTVRVMFDVSDLVYYIGHHPNLTGIQRVQSSIILAIASNGMLPQGALLLLSFNARARKWTNIPAGFFISLLNDLYLPERQRLVKFSTQDACDGILPGATEFDGYGILDDGVPSVFCLLGAAWVQPDFFHHLSDFRRRFNTKIVLTIHDLIPIYAGEMCDQGTALVFEEFLRRALRHADHFICVSEHTAKDLRRYAASSAVPLPPITVSRNGSSFQEFFPQEDVSVESSWDGVPERFVLFVATIEGRKNHRLILEVWRRMVEQDEDVPSLICVGRVGWKCEAFIAGLVESNYIDGKVILLEEVSDAQLKSLYRKCLFTLCPSQYEGWGLPVGESLAAGKVCVCSDRTSIPEVAGEAGVYIDINDSEQTFTTIRNLIRDRAALGKLEAKIRRGYTPITWRSVAERVLEACLASRTSVVSARNAIPYSTEISFASAPRRDRQPVCGEALVARIVDARKGLFLFEPMNDESFLKGEDARSGDNWAEPENWGTWLCHSGGELVLDLAPNDAAVYFVYLRLRASGPVSDLQARLHANGELVWADSIGPRARNITLRVRKKTQGSLAWRLRIRAEVTLTPELRDKIASLDGRLPTIGFERLLMVPENDLKTRIEVLTKATM